MIPSSIRICDIKLTLMNREELKEHLIQSVYDKEKFRIVLLDEKKFYHSLFDSSLRQTINSAEIVLCASQTVRWAYKMLRRKTVPIILPVTLFLDLLRAADEMGYTIFLYGGTREDNVEAVKRVKRSFPNARVVGNYNSQIEGEELDNVLTAIRKGSPQIFFANLRGLKNGEAWISEHTEFFPTSIVVGVENAFEIISGKHKMPPIWVQKREWTGLYRFLQNPLNIFRIFRVMAIFFVTIYRKIFKKENELGG